MGFRRILQEFVCYFQDLGSYGFYNIEVEIYKRRRDLNENKLMVNERKEIKDVIIELLFVYRYRE